MAGLVNCEALADVLERWRRSLTSPLPVSTRDLFLDSIEVINIFGMTLLPTSCLCFLAKFPVSGLLMELLVLKDLREMSGFPMEGLDWMNLYSYPPSLSFSSISMLLSVFMSSFALPASFKLNEEGNSFCECCSGLLRLYLATLILSTRYGIVHAVGEGVLFLSVP